MASFISSQHLNQFTQYVGSPDNSFYCCTEITSSSLAVPIACTHWRGLARLSWPEWRRLVLVANRTSLQFYAHISGHDCQPPMLVVVDNKAARGCVMGFSRNVGVLPGFSTVIGIPQKAADINEISG